MSDAHALDAAAVAAVIRRALTQKDDVPQDERLSFRVLCELALPLLEHMAKAKEQC